MRWPSDAALALDARAAAGARGRPRRGRRRRGRSSRAGPLAGGRAPAAADRPHRRAPARAHGRGAREGARADRPDRRAGRAARSARPGRWPPRRARRRAAAAPRPSWPQPERLEQQADLAEKVCRQITPAARRREDHRPARLARRPGRAPDRQGQARQALRVRLRLPARRADAQHAPRRARADPAGRQPDRLPERERAAARRPSPSSSASGSRPREIALDGGFPVEAANQALPQRRRVRRRPTTPAVRRSKKRLASYRAGAEGRISHLKRGYGLRRSRLRGHDGARTWTGWGILTYNLDTLAVQTP